MNMRNPFLHLVCLAAACGGAPAESARRSSQTDLVVANGEELNGEELNGEELNGTALGSRLASVSLSGVVLSDGTALDTAWLEGTVFHGTAGAAQFGGADFDRAHFFATSDTGVTVELRVRGITALAPPDDDVWTYGVQFRSDAGWVPLCGGQNDDNQFQFATGLFGNDQGGGVKAIPVSGAWDGRRGVPGAGGKIADSGVFTFGCMGIGAIAKCVYPIGYKPWKTVGGVLLDRHHQACVRLIRADFCGDGTPNTKAGNRVNVYDGVGVQQDTKLWLIEAEWDENGARCFNPLNRSHALLAPCFNDRALAACGAPIDFYLGALLMDETPPLSSLSLF